MRVEHNDLHNKHSGNNVWEAFKVFKKTSHQLFNVIEMKKENFKSIKF